MERDKALSITLLLLISLAIAYILTRTQSNPLYLLLGCLSFITLQLLLALFYTLLKLHRTYRQSHSITLKKNTLLDPQGEYGFQESVKNQQFYFNKFTEEANLFSQNHVIKIKETQNVQKFYFEEVQIQEPRKNTMEFLKEIQDYYQQINLFTDVLIGFGNDLVFIEKGSIFKAKKYKFCQFQNTYPPEIPIQELTQTEGNIFKDTNTKLQRIKGEDKLLFPSWMCVIDVLKFIGNQFHKIQDIRKSNSQMLAMIHKKILDDFQLLEKKIITIGKQLNETIKNLSTLKKQYTKSQDAEFTIVDTNQVHLDMMHWFRKQYYTFRDLQRRIKENQLLFKQKTRQKEYYQEKISGYRSQSQKAFLKTLKTRYFAFLDSYHISVDESLKKMQQSFYNHSYCPIQRPKVHNIEMSTNLNEALKAEKQYQVQYFKRVQYYQHILENLIDSLDSMQEFLNNLRNVFTQMIKNLEACQEKFDKTVKYFRKVIEQLLKYSIKIFTEISQLISVNEKLKVQNINNLKILHKQINIHIQRARGLLDGIDVRDGPIKYKFANARVQIEGIYQEIECRLEKVQQFEQIFLLHSGRIKKIVVTNLMQFLYRQKILIDLKNLQPSISDNAISLVDDIHAQMISQNQNEPSIYNDEDIRGDSLQTGHQFSAIYVRFLNQFLFVCYSEWKNSNYFKTQLSQQLFIAFNKDPNESFSRIQVSELEFSGLPPEVVWLKELKTQQPESFFDIQIAFKGTIKFKVNTIYKLIRDIPVQVFIQINEFYCVMRFCFVPSNFGKGWFSFIGEPITKFKIVPSIGNYRFDIETLRSIFNNFLLGKLKRMTYPIKQRISIPASKKDQDLKMIQKRFKAIQEMQN